ncbi:MAG TPA: peptidoglycan-binding protein [Gaiellaceae bacterium]|nr:peptidoglycan-binding protein [Gaiellaceae bacterium]
MPRVSILLAAVCTALALADSAAAGNPQIAGLQAALRAHGSYRGPIDGVQGPRTKAAVRAFQRRRGLTVDGLAGPQTRRALGRLGKPLYGRRVLRRGAIGYDVAVLQFLLRRSGYRVGRIDGHFGPQTELIVRRFQRRNHVPADGMVGARTSRELCGVRSCAWRGPRLPAARAARPAAKVHHVRPGETLTAISSRYRLSVNAIARANRLNPRGTLLAGIRLRIPRHAGNVVVRVAIRQQPFDVRSALDYWSKQYGVDPRLVRAVAWWESGYANHLTSSKGAEGVMQVTPVTWNYVERYLAGRRIPHTMDGNVRVGVLFLRQMLREFNGDVPMALAGYVQGPTSVRTKGMFPETKFYVRGVRALMTRV